MLGRAGLRWSSVLRYLARRVHSEPGTYMLEGEGSTSCHLLRPGMEGPGVCVFEACDRGVFEACDRNVHTDRKKGSKGTKHRTHHITQTVLTVLQATQKLSVSRQAIKRSLVRSRPARRGHTGT